MLRANQKQLHKKENFGFGKVKPCISFSLLRASILKLSKGKNSKT